MLMSLQRRLSEFAARPMTGNSALQHRSCQSATHTDQSCCAEQSSKQTAGLCHCKFTCESLLLTHRHNDQQQCTAAQIQLTSILTTQICVLLSRTDRVRHLNMTGPRWIVVFVDQPTYFCSIYFVKQCSVLSPSGFTQDREFAC